MGKTKKPKTKRIHALKKWAWVQVVGLPPGNAFFSIKTKYKIRGVSCPMGARNMV
jgi:hypothetical protein